MGLPAGQPLTRHPYLLALADEYTVTVRRLRANFTGPATENPPPPVPEDVSWAGYLGSGPADPFVCAFRALAQEARDASGPDCGQQPPDAQAYQRYREWLPFHHRRRTVIDRVTVALGYPRTAAR